MSGEVFDPQESDPRLSDEFAQTDRKAEREVGNVKRNEKFIFVFWAVKKRILKRDFGIDWKSPAELNPQIQYENYGQPKLTASEKSHVELTVRPHMGADESVIYIWREYTGVINLTTKSKSDRKVRIYYVKGPEEAWAVEGPFEIAFD